MKFTAIIVSATAASAFMPASTFVRQTTLNAHTLGGWTPTGALPSFSSAQAAAPIEAAPVFSGFSHAYDSATVAAAAPAAASKPAAAVFTGFSHAYETTEAAAPVEAAPVFSGFSHAYDSQTVEAAAPAAASKPAAPIFSGFGHAYTEAAKPAYERTEPAVIESGPVFSGFSHAY
eukprot:CAMPEP_0194199124 /NCGR_PEP_ID=MMETSP0156-20130528/259_1 /TAXON_ID=33649 /ORGANISM="Thalassionema nitzschioides, Strain L26-B" /LENGTH=174 /DNA_ID=CAMNT_0038923975 /DNA_START=1 /DNA_END=525 /DNA_ORIENTATION=+